MSRDTIQGETGASSSAASSSIAAPPRIVAPDGLTNKERRLAKQAEKRKRVQDDDREVDGVSAGTATEASQSTVKAEVKHSERPSGSVVRKEGAADEAAAEAGDGRDRATQDGEEVEALSHKEQRKRRRMEKKGLLPAYGADGGVGSAAPGSSTAEKKPDLPERSPYAVWIGNLSFMTNAQRLQSWLEEKGLRGISRVHMPKGIKKFEQNRGFAYVDLPSAEAVQDGVALSEDHLEGRRLLIKSATDYTGRPALNPAMAALAQASTSLASGPNGISTTSNGVDDAVSTGAAGDPGDSIGVRPSRGTPAAIMPAGGKTGLTKTAQKILRSQKNPAGPTLFVGNLSFNSTQEGLLDLFERSAKGREGWTKSVKERKREEKREKRLADSAEAKKRRAERDTAKKASKVEGDESDGDDDSEGGDEDSSSDESSSSSSSSSDNEEEDSEGIPRGAGIRKVRMGTFEDTGKCKGFAFVDFHSPIYSTASLIDPHNYRLDGRELTIEFAGADAVRRGAPKTQRVGGAGASGGGRSPWSSSKDGPDRRTKEMERNQKNMGSRPERLRQAADTAAAAATAAVPAGDVVEVGPTSSNPNHKENQAERRARREKEAAAKGGYTRRAKPGAALANAQRGRVGIDTSGEAGKKVTFD